MKYFLLYKDGRRVETNAGGGQYIIAPKFVDGRRLETRFECLDDVVDGCLVYTERETEDVTEKYEESLRRIEQWRRDAKQRHDAALRTRAARLLQRLAERLEGIN